MKTTRIRNILIEYLNDKPRSTAEILDYVNSRTKHGTTTHVLGNILAKDRRFKKVGMTMRMSCADRIPHSYAVTIWGLNSFEGMAYAEQ